MPMGFQTLDEHIQSGKYRKLYAFLEDLMLIFVNVYSVRSIIFGEAEKLYNTLTRDVLPILLANAERTVNPQPSTLNPQPSIWIWIVYFKYLIQATTTSTATISTNIKKITHLTTMISNFLKFDI